MHSNATPAYGLVAEVELQDPAHEAEVSRPEGNDLVPVCLLPPEILSEIFVYYRDVCAHPHWNRHELVTKPWLVWTNVTHVCHHWRETALSHPPLWSQLMVDYGPWSKEMFKRSKTAQLNVFLSPPPTPQAEEFLQTILSEFGRIEVLRTGLSATPMQQTLLKHLRVPAPRLRELDLSSATRPLNLPTDLFRGIAPNLRSLSFGVGTFVWASLLPFTSLSSLKLDFTFPESPRSPEEFLEAVVQMPTLVQLDIQIDIDNAEHEWRILRTRGYHLQHLQRLKLGARSVDQLFLFMKCIAIPPATQINLRCSCASRVQAALTKDLIEVLHANCWAGPMAASTSPRSLSSLELDLMSVSTRSGLEVSGWYEIVDIQSPPTKDFGLKLFGFGFAEAPLTGLLCSLPIDNLASIHVKPSLETQDLERLCSLIHLEEIRLHDPNARQVLWWYTDADYLEYFPHLRTFVFTDVYFLDEDSERGDDFLSIGWGEIVALANSIQAKSHQRGGQIWLRCCIGVDTAYVGKLIAAIPSCVVVDWDGVICKSFDYSRWGGAEEYPWEHRVQVGH